jgi:hypothetical protein
MAFSCLSTIGKNIYNNNSTIVNLVNPPINVNFQTTIGVFTTIFGGTPSPNLTQTTQKTISGTSHYNGTYYLRCNNWICEGSAPSYTGSNLGYLLDNNINTYCSSNFPGSNPRMGANGTQIGSGGDTVYNTSGVYTGTMITTYDTSLSVAGDYIEIQLPMGIKLKTFSMIARAGVGSRVPRGLFFLGSNNGTTWTLLETHTNTNTIVQWINMTINSTTSYTYIRMIINTLQTASSGGIWNLAGINMTFDVA